MSFKRMQRGLVKGMAVLVILSVVFCIGLYIYRSVFGYTYDNSLSGTDLSANVQADESITNIALFGLDTREGDTASHSDAVMIVTIDNVSHQVKMVSLMRDSLVNIEEHGQDKLNAAYFYGGAALAIRTINQNFGTDIENYMAIDFDQLATIVDALDGVTINVQDYELNEVNRVIEDYGIEQGQVYAGLKSAGEQRLTGVQAMCYARIRKDGTGDDWARVERQSIVMSALFDEVKDLKASKLLKLMQTLLPEVTTSLAPNDLASLVVGAVKDGAPTLSHTRVPLDGEWEYGGAENEYIVYNLDTAAEHIRAYIYDDVMPGNTASAHAASGSTTPTGPMGEGGDFDTAPSAPAGTTATDKPATDSSENPASLAEEGGSYDAATGDYQDADGDYYALDEDGETRYYYDQESYRAEHGLD